MVKKKVKAKAKSKPKIKKPALPKIEGKVVGKITHYFPKVQAGVIKVKAPIKSGDTLRIKGHTTDLTQTIASMQIDRTSIKSAKKGDEIGILVNSRVRQHDVVYKI